MHFPLEVNVETIDNIDVKTVDAAVDVNKEFIAAQYDIIFGDGTFKKIYKEYPDVLALEDALVPLGKAIAEKIEEQYKEREEEVKNIENEYLKHIKERN